MVSAAAPAIRIRVAGAADRERLVGFVRDHWSSTHIFVDHPDVFDWQYGQNGGRLNMILAEDASRPGGEPGDVPGDVLGILGFIPLGRFDPALGDRDIMLAIWKVRDGAPPGLGLRLLKMIQREFRPRLIAAIGTSAIVRPIYEVLGYRVGSLHHAALFNPARRGATRVADGVPDAAFDHIAASTSVRLVPLHGELPAATRTAIDHLAGAAVPAKSSAYLAERYLRHPWYRYDVRAVHHDGTLDAVVVWRAVEHGGGRVLRIVDVIGATAWLGDAAQALRAELAAADAEYVDVMHYGADPAVLRRGGFVSPSEHPDLILPNYFAPFEQRNVDVQLAFKVLDRSADPDLVHLYRADSDQDRPNQPADLHTTT